MLLLKAAKTQKWPREVGRWAGAQSPDKAGKYQPQDKERKKRFLGSGETHLHMVGGHKPQASRSGMRRPGRLLTETRGLCNRWLDRMVLQKQRGRRLA